MLAGHAAAQNTTAVADCSATADWHAAAAAAAAAAACLQGIQQLNHEQLLSRDNIDASGNSLGGLTGGTGHSSGIHGGAITPSTVTPATTAGSLPTGPYSYSTTTCSSSLTGGPPGRSEGSFMAAATAGGALEFGSTVGTHASWTGSMHGSMASAGGSFNGLQGLGRSYTTKQVCDAVLLLSVGMVC